MYHGALSHVLQEGHDEVLELLAGVTQQGALSNTFDPVSKVRREHVKCEV